MSRIKRALLFGCTSGLLWTTVPFWFSSRSPENLKIFVPAGIACGVLVSLVLYKPLLIADRLTLLLLSVLSLLLSAFCFGFFVGLFGWLVGGPAGGVVDDRNSGSPLFAGLMYLYGTAAICLKPVWALLLGGLSILTNWLLRVTLNYQRNPPPPS